MDSVLVALLPHPQVAVMLGLYQVQHLERAAKGPGW